jgi:quinol monooxygenase YgiN
VPFAVFARYVCAEEDIEVVRSALLSAREGTLREPANLTYVVHQDADDARVFLLYEQYTDRAGFDTHVASPHFAEHISGEVRPRLLDRTVSFGEVL